MKNEKLIESCINHLEKTDVVDATKESLAEDMVDKIVLVNNAVITDCEEKLEFLEKEKEDLEKILDKLEELLEGIRNVLQSLGL